MRRSINISAGRAESSQCLMSLLITSACFSGADSLQFLAPTQLICSCLCSPGPSWQILIWTMRGQTLKLSSVWWSETMLSERRASSAPGPAMPRWLSTNYSPHTCPQSGRLTSTECARRSVWKIILSRTQKSILNKWCTMYTSIWGHWPNSALKCILTSFMK